MALVEVAHALKDLVGCGDLRQQVLSGLLGSLHLSLEVSHSHPLRFYSGLQRLDRSHSSGVRIWFRHDLWLVALQDAQLLEFRGVALLKLPLILRRRCLLKGSNLAIYLGQVALQIVDAIVSLLSE